MQFLVPTLHLKCNASICFVESLMLLAKSAQLSHHTVTLLLDISRKINFIFDYNTKKLKSTSKNKLI